MVTLTGRHLYLRALEPDDLEFIHRIENDERLWQVSNTRTPYSRFLIRQYLENAHHDIYEVKQLRLAICKQHTFEAVGLIDLFDFEPHHRRAGIGIVIANGNDRDSGMGSEALELLIGYAFGPLNLHQLYANIAPNNAPSVKLFTKFGFVAVGTKKDWNLAGGTFEDETLYQLIKPVNTL